MTNVAIAGPRSAVHMAHAAYDLQSYSEGRFRLGLGSQIKVHIEKRYGSQWGRPAARMAETVAAIKAVFACLGRQVAVEFSRRVLHAHADAAELQSRPEPVRAAPGTAGCAGPGDDPHRRRGGRRAAGDAVQQCAGISPTGRCPRWPRACAGRAGTPGEFGLIVQAMVAVGRTEEDLAAAVNGVSTLISFYGSTPAYVPVLEEEGWADLQPRLNVLSKQGGYAEMRALITPEMVQTIGVAGTPEECAAEIGRRFGGARRRRVLLLPGLHAAASKTSPTSSPRCTRCRARYDVRRSWSTSSTASRSSPSTARSGATPTPPRWARG